MSFAADHEVTDHAAFLAALEIAIAAARDGWLVTIGLSPTRPETGFGYIERTDEPVVTTPLGAAFRVSRFVEKPDRSRAEQYVASGRYLWNASMFIWRARTLLAEVERLQPEVASGVARIAESWGTPMQDRVTAEVWATMPESTIDQGILEHAERIAVVPADLGWSDVGDWNNIGDLIERDDAGNSVRGEMVQSMTHDCVVWSETGRLIALVGLDSIAVVDTDDALLVVDRKHAQEVRRIVDQLKATHRRGT
jgi:mannose-1-phosphate guanylyltransferase